MRSRNEALNNSTRANYSVLPELLYQSWNALFIVLMTDSAEFLAIFMDLANTFESAEGTSLFRMPYSLMLDD